MKVDTPWGLPFLLNIITILLFMTLVRVFVFVIIVIGVFMITPCRATSYCIAGQGMLFRYFWYTCGKVTVQMLLSLPLLLLETNINLRYNIAEMTTPRISIFGENYLFL